MQAITPTVGRKVWYYEQASQPEPFDGTVVRVFPDPDGNTSPESLCNIFVVEPGGHTRLVPMIRAAVEGDPCPHFRWMPYQLAQAGVQPMPTPSDPPPTPPVTDDPPQP